VSPLSCPPVGPPRGLHSSPTRRSSDLLAEHLLPLVGRDAAYEELPVVGRQVRCHVLDELARLDAKLLLPRDVEVTGAGHARQQRSEEHTSELQSRENLVCRLLLEKKTA